jgi:Uma2 family endonuclease
MSAIPAEPAVFLGPDHNGTLMMPEEFDDIEDFDEEFRYELIHGVVIVTPIPLAEESDPNDELGHLLRLYREGHPHGAEIDATMPQQYVRTSTGRRLADRVIWIGLGRMPNRKVDIPTIAIEFVSARSRDRKRDYEEKREEYEEAGIREYWIIDRFRRIMTVVSNKPTGSEDRIVTESEIFTTPMLPGFELPLARLLALADAWGRAD